VAGFSLVLFLLFWTRGNRPEVPGQIRKVPGTALELFKEE
jgi:hypothetical protein